MDEQRSLLDDTPGLSRRDHPVTAKHAASLVKTGSIRWEVLSLIATRSAIATFGGCTDEELADFLQRSENTVRPRRIECVADEWVVDSGLKRDSKWGRPMIVWTITDAGRGQVAEAQAKLAS